MEQYITADRKKKQRISQAIQPDARAAAPCVECGAQETGRGGGSKHPVGGPDPPRKLPSCLCCRSSGIMFPDLSQIRDYVPGKGCRLWVSEVFLIRKTAFSAHCAALYHTVTHCVACQGDSTYLTFFRSFRANLRVGIPAGLLVLAAGALLLQGYQIMVLAANSVGGGALAMYGCYCAALIVPAGVSCWAFPLLSRFQMGLGHLLVTSFQVTLRHLPQTLLLILLLFVTVWTTAGFFPLAVFTPALNALLASLPAERVIRRYLPEEENGGEEEL